MTSAKTIPPQQARQEEVVRELQTVRNLVLYGETLANTTMTVNGSPVDQSAFDITAAARSIISEHAVVLPVANLTGRQSLSFSGADLRCAQQCYCGFDGSRFDLDRSGAACYQGWLHG